MEERFAFAAHRKHHRIVSLRLPPEHSPTDYIMFYDVRIISSQEFIRFDAGGQMDLSASQRMLADALWACMRTGIGRVLLDVGEATTNMTAAQVCTLADTCRRIAAPAQDHKIAILNRPCNEFDRAAVVAAEAEDQGWNIQVFHDFESAFDWLGT